jgi:acetoin utilization deacetylase AcuC-like enzyme
LRRIRRHRPEVVVVSVGYDIAKGDPTGGFGINAHGFEDVGKLIGALDVPLLLIQEGGYKVRHLGTYARFFLLGVASTRP